jgi:aminoglycoside phosphotransferase (APT) family kinase protein
MLPKNTFFNELNDFDGIIAKALNCDKSAIALKKINTGWTNFVFNVQIGNSDYIARFPRGAFFASAMEADVKASKFVKTNTDIKTADIDVYYDYISSRPFSIHKKILGTTLTSRMPILKEKDFDNLAKEIADFYNKMHSIDIKKIPLKLKRKLSAFLKGVMGEVSSYKDYSGIEDLERCEEKVLVAVHGDLNIGNIIVDNSNRIIAFLDFAFFGVSCIEVDLARISCRIGEDFFDKIIFYYEKKSEIPINRIILNKQKKLWTDIETHYIGYMSEKMPDIQVIQKS